MNFFRALETLLVIIHDIILTLVCDSSCEFDCTGPGNKACKACRHGYEMVDGECKGQ